MPTTITRRNFNKALIAGAAVLSMPAIAKSRDKFVYAVPGPITPAIANLTMALELGYFDEERLDVELISLAGSAIIIPQIVSGAVQASGASLDPVIVSRDPGKPNFPVKFIYNLNRNMIWEMAVLPDSPYKGMEDLDGVVIGVSSLAANNIPHQAMLRASGVDPSTVTFQAVGIGMQAYEALRTKQVQVLGLWDVTHAAIEANAGPLRRLDVPSEFRGRSSHGLEVSNQHLERDPDLFARFGRAMTKGTVASMANPQGSLIAFWRRYPELKRQGSSDEEILKQELPVMKARLDNQTYFPDGAEQQWGAFSKEDWTLLLRILHEGGVLQNPDIPLDSLYTNSLVPDFNAFDSESVIAQGKNYT